MYLPSHFAEERLDLLHAAMRDHPFATLVTQGPDGAVADHLPLLLHVEADGGGVLHGHVARANPVWRNHPADTEVLVIFHGPQAYVTPSWYPTKHEHGKAVPTWNYQVVHATGCLRIIDDASWKRNMLDALTNCHEAGFADPWQVSDAPADYIEAMLAAIVGIEIRITRLQGKFKLSQNQPAGNRAGVVAGLRQVGDDNANRIANWIESNEPVTNAR